MFTGAPHRSTAVKAPGYAQLMLNSRYLCKICALLHSAILSFHLVQASQPPLVSAEECGGVLALTCCFASITTAKLNTPDSAYSSLPTLPFRVINLTCQRSARTTTITNRSSDPPLRRVSLHHIIHKIPQFDPQTMILSPECRASEKMNHSRHTALCQYNRTSLRV